MSGMTPFNTLCFAALLAVPQLRGQPAFPASISHVLDLDGKTAYVELPPNILNDLDEATVEAWVKWRSFPTNYGARLFSYGEAFHDAGIQVDADGSLNSLYLPKPVRGEEPRDCVGRDADG